jgi:GNAT superfamily N-acetyltransferase
MIIKVIVEFRNLKLIKSFVDEAEIDLKDKKGRDYNGQVMLCESRMEIRIYRKEVYVGFVSCLAEPEKNQTCLSELFMFWDNDPDLNSWELKKPWWMKIQVLLKIEPESYQDLGLGKLLISMVEQFAVQCHTSRLYGHVLEKNASDKLYLWYQRQGFSLYEPTDEDRLRYPSAKKRIEKIIVE